MSFMDSLDDVGDALSRKSDGRSVQKIALNRITPDPKQPRKVFDQTALEELARSIEARGVIQPITLRTLDEGKTYVIRFGERRWRAAGLAGLADIPAIVTEEGADENERIDQVIENDQRADLSPIEMAQAVNEMVADGLSKETISKRLGRPRADVSMYASLSEFPDELAGDFLARSSIRAVYNLFVAWKTAPEQVLAFVAEHQAGVTTARAAAFVRSLKNPGEQSREEDPGREGDQGEGRQGEGGQGEPLYVQRPEGGQAERKNEQPGSEPSKNEGGGQAEKSSKAPAAPKPKSEAKPVLLHIFVEGRAATIQLPDVVEVQFEDGELVTIPASKIDPS